MLLFTPGLIDVFMAIEISTEFLPRIGEPAPPTLLDDEDDFLSVLLRLQGLSIIYYPVPLSVRMLATFSAAAPEPEIVNDTITTEEDLNPPKLTTFSPSKPP